jgi:large subunit ribosomal protein L22
MEISATTRFTRLSALKARDLARRVQGLPATEALKITGFSERKAALLLGKTLKSAIANAENRAKLSVDKLRVKEAVIDEGPRQRRFWARSRGSASPILKRMCHIRIVLTDDAGGSGGSDGSVSE